jgi:hypothetical protein
MMDFKVSGSVRGGRGVRGESIGTLRNPVALEPLA